MAAQDMARMLKHLLLKEWFQKDYETLEEPRADILKAFSAIRKDSELRGSSSFLTLVPPESKCRGRGTVKSRSG